MVNFNEKCIHVLKALYDKKARFKIFNKLGLYKNMLDEEYIKLMFEAETGQILDFENVKTFNEKLQWLKLNDRNELYTTLVDKYLVKNYVASVIGSQYVIPTLGVWENANDINFDLLPNKFVLKCNHNSGLGLCICKDKSRLDYRAVREKLNKGLKQDYFLNGREWPYKNVPRKIIAEKYMENKSGVDELNDYKFHCFHGIPDNVMVCCERNTGTPKFYFFDMEWNLRRYNGWGINAPREFTLPKPECFEDMLEKVKILCRDLPFVRVDMYNISGKPYFGELTFYPQSGLDTNLTLSADNYLGSLIDLSKVKVRRL